ncbi:hypothetical protein [Nostoc sp. PCC 9305]|uniref:hypothetical protein n=1 Tax=Nostoc sp. PCC 9305 TaxID=296636 RepID=UPI0039C63D2B
MTLDSAALATQERLTRLPPALSTSRTEYPTEFWLLTPEFCFDKYLLSCQVEAIAFFHIFRSNHCI